MKRWLLIGAGLLLVAWAPFLYAELTSEPAEKKVRELPTETAEEEVVGEVQPEHAEQPVAAKQAAAPVEPPEEAHAAKAPPDEAAEAVAPQAAARQPELPAQQAPEPEPVPPAEDEEPAEADEEVHEEEAPPPVASGPTAQLKKAYETEPRDALWATDTERRIAAVFASDDVPDGMLQRASCRRAVCSLEVRWRRDHATQYVGAFQVLRDQFGGEIGVDPVGVPDDDGQQVVHLYVLRKGYTAADVAK